MSFRMYKSGAKTNDYKMFDKVIGEQFVIGGVDAWLYTYEGAKSDTNETLPLTTIADPVFGENARRTYNTQAITIVVAYQVQESLPNIQIPGMFSFTDMMDITIHYNSMMQRVGRKIIAGDVLELPNLRDTDVLGKEIGINRFYVVQDAFRAAEGYSATWQHHIWKLRVKPITDSPEFSDLLGDNSYPASTDPNNPDPNNPDHSDDTGISNGQAELDIMNRILAIADGQVPYLHFDKEHIYDDSTNNQYLMNDILSGYDYPVKPYNGMYFKKLTSPVLYEKQSNSEYTVLPTSVQNEFPAKPKADEFVFIETSIHDGSTFVLYQYYKDEKRWIKCDVQYLKTGTGDDDFYVKIGDSVLMQYLDNNWTVAKDMVDIKPFTSNDIAWNIHHPHDAREGIPPARGDVPEGTTFPETPTDGQYFYRTDYTPVTLWKYNASTKAWSMFNYGGRLPWTGAVPAMSEYVNSSDRVSIRDVVLPNIQYRK